MVLLHGKLYMHLKGAKDLWGKDRSVKERFSQVFVGGEVDPYLSVYSGDRRLAKTHVIRNNQNPVWDVEIDVDVACSDPLLTFHVKTANERFTGKTKSLGYAYINNNELVAKEVLEGEFKLSGSDKKEDKKNRGCLVMKLVYTPVAKVKGALETPNCYFALRKGCRVKLYGDAHVPEGMLPEIHRGDGSVYEHGQCWIDIYKAIKAAKKFIYMTGWSIFTRISLIRDRKIDGEQLTVGELLAQKAEEGVLVRVLIWDEIISKDGKEAATGLMCTHDEETTIWFNKNTKVKCRKVPRADDGTSGLFGGIAVAGLFTHHQKSVILDAPSRYNPSKFAVRAFVGGLDITDGRFDTPEHSLFRTLTTYHKDPDFHQACVAGLGPDTGPREPWHDIHSQLEGPVAMDVLQNFADRWSKQTEDTQNFFLFDFKRDGKDFVNPFEEAKITAQEPDAWSAQFYRSIDSRSAHFSFEIEGALASKKGRDVDYSIAKAYVHHIRRAKHFIYIENQYFLGSSHMWPNDPHPDMAPHLIPFELALKVYNKIKAGERFALYINVPMFPEGLPNAQATQEILYWQLRTVEMIYMKAAEALVEIKSLASPSDYINIFCLGTRETEEGSQAVKKPDPTSTAGLLAKTRRHCIYLHSKMMIIDDEYIIIGSANINERSMAGTRDTEMAAGMFQNAHLATDTALPRGDVHAFRCALFAEHLGFFDDRLLNPHEKECVDLVVSEAEKNWNIYTGDETVDMKGHLLRYPYKIMRNGRIHGDGNFPDTTGYVGGAKSALPDTLTS